MIILRIILNTNIIESFEKGKEKKLQTTGTPHILI